MNSEISIPTLLLNKQVCLNNIRSMTQKADENEVILKPHMKTHQSATIGRWMQEAGINSITVSSLEMAWYFAENNWKDITIAFPANVREQENIAKLAETVSLTLLLNSPFSVKKIDDALTNKVKAYIEIDTGSNRTGLKVSQDKKILELIKSIEETKNIDWLGFYSHPGHSYASRSKNEILTVYREVQNQVKTLRQKFSGYSKHIEICIGDTPCCSVATDFTGIDAISPGNFVFYDVMQAQIGSCNVSDIAVAVECPIVDRFPERNELAIHGGAIHFSKESLSTDDVTHFGYPADLKKGKWEILTSDSFVRKLSQEHGIISCQKEVFNRYQIGDTITILPVHSCLTAHLMGEYLTLESNETVEHLSNL